MTKPKITTKCPANQHTLPNETIAEFSVRKGGKLLGGLISLRLSDNGELHVSVYQTDPGVVVIGASPIGNSPAEED